MHPLQPWPLTFAECRPQGQSHSWGETMLQIPIEPGFLLLYNAPHPLLPPLLLCSLLHKNFSPHKVHVWIWSLYSGLLCLHIRLEAGGKEKTPPSLSHLLMSFFFFFFFSLPFFFLLVYFPQKQSDILAPVFLTKPLIYPWIINQEPTKCLPLGDMPWLHGGEGRAGCCSNKEGLYQERGGRNLASVSHLRCGGSTNEMVGPENVTGLVKWTRAGTLLHWRDMMWCFQRCNFWEKCICSSQWLCIMEYDELCNEHSGAAWREWPVLFVFQKYRWHPREGRGV